MTASVEARACGGKMRSCHPPTPYSTKSRLNPPPLRSRSVVSCQALAQRATAPEILVDRAAETRPGTTGLGIILTITSRISQAETAIKATV
jgi:hypothetical protein